MRFKKKLYTASILSLLVNWVKEAGISYTSTMISNGYLLDAETMSKFEHEFGCTEGLISNTFRHNPYMRMAVGKWGQSLKLAKPRKDLSADADAIESFLPTISDL